jgi:uncharacterized protein (DUF983 family)
MRSLQPSLLLTSPAVRGFLGRCPRCGQGRMFRAFLEVSDRCEFCGEELFHHRADDFPAYVVIFIVGHILVPGALAVEMHFAPPYWVHLALWLPAALKLTLGLLQPAKGVIVALQWSLGLGGFEFARTKRLGLAHADVSGGMAPATAASSLAS